MPGTKYCGSNSAPQTPHCSDAWWNRGAGDTFTKWEGREHQIAHCPANYTERRTAAGGGWNHGPWGNAHGGAHVYRKRACVAKGSAEKCCKANPEDFTDHYLNINKPGEIIDCKTYTEDPTKCDNVLKKICGGDARIKHDGLSLMQRIVGRTGLAGRCQKWCTEQAQEGKRSCDKARKEYCSTKNNMRCSCINARPLNPPAMEKMQTIFQGVNHHCWMDSCSDHKNAGVLALGAYKDVRCPSCVQVAYAGNVNADTTFNVAQKCATSDGGEKTEGVVDSGSGDDRVTKNRVDDPLEEEEDPAKGSFMASLTTNQMMIGGAVLVGLVLLVVFMRNKNNAPPAYMMAPQPIIMAPQPVAAPAQ